MSINTLAALVDRLPKGRARRRYEKLLVEIGDDTLAVAVPYADAQLWFVTGPAQAVALTNHGVQRWRIWTLNEANTVLDVCGSPANTIAEAARLFATSQGRSDKEVEGR